MLDIVKLLTIVGLIGLLLLHPQPRRGLIGVLNAIIRAIRFPIEAASSG
jgi:preprotein translocase subunit SecG